MMRCSLPRSNRARPMSQALPPHSILPMPTRRARALFAQEYISQQDLDTSVQAKKAAQAQLQTSRAQLDRDKANLAYSVIRSPVSGVVVARNIDIGQTVAASFQTPTLFQIAQDLSKMQID